MEFWYYVNIIKFQGKSAGSYCIIENVGGGKKRVFFTFCCASVKNVVGLK